MVRSEVRRKCGCDKRERAPPGVSGGARKVPVLVVTKDKDIVAIVSATAGTSCSIVFAWRPPRHNRAVGQCVEPRRRQRRSACRANPGDGGAGCWQLAAWELLLEAHGGWLKRRA